MTYAARDLSELLHSMPPTKPVYYRGGMEGYGDGEINRVEEFEDCIELSESQDKGRIECPASK